MSDIPKTKIIATVGPASSDQRIINELIEAGVNFIRINTKYSSEDWNDKIQQHLLTFHTDDKIKILFDIVDVDKLKYAQNKNIKTIALSFVENPTKVEEARKIVSDAFIISKIESQKGVGNFDSILEVSDGIMVARGDLGRAVSLEKVPPLQKEFTLKTLKKGKFLITATEMLLSMTHNPLPTRAEVSDVANAVFDRSSAVMLSEETAIGKYPVGSVQMMRKIIVEAERWMSQR